MSSANNNSNGGTLKSCGACKQDMARSAFSKKQWDRKKFRRCKACVQNENPFQRPSKKDHPQPENKKENLPVVVVPPTKELIHDKPEVAPERPPLDPVVLDDSQLNVDKEIHVSTLEEKPEQVLVNETTLQEGTNQISTTTVNTAAMNGSSDHITEQPSKIKEDEPMDPIVLSESTKCISSKDSVEVLLEPPPASNPSADIVGDENTVEKSPVVAIIEEDTEVTPPAPKDQQSSDPIHCAQDNSTTHLPSPSSEHLSRNDPTPSSESKTPSTVEEMVQEHDAIFRAVIEPDEGQLVESEQYYADLHRVSTEEVMDIDVEPIVNVEQEIYELLHPSSSSAAEQGILSGDHSPEELKDQEDDHDSPSATSSERRPSTTEQANTTEASTSSVPNKNAATITPMSNKEQQASEAANTMDETTTTTGPSSETVPPPPATPTARESIESDALDWDPSAMANLSPTPSMPSSPPPPVPPIAAEDNDDEENGGNQQTDSFSRILSQYSSALGYTCGTCILGVILSALLIPHDHAVLLVFAGLSVIMATLMLVADLYGKDFNDDDTSLDKKSIVRFSCFISVLGLMLSAMLLPRDHALLLVFAGMAVVSAGIMLVSQLYADGRGGTFRRSANNNNDGLLLGDAMAVDDSSLREPLLSGTPDRVIISDEV